MRGIEGVVFECATSGMGISHEWGLLRLGRAYAGRRAEDDYTCPAESAPGKTLFTRQACSKDGLPFPGRRSQPVKSHNKRQGFNAGLSMNGVRPGDGREPGSESDEGTHRPSSIRNTVAIESPLGLRSFTLHVGDVAQSMDTALIVPSHANAEFALDGAGIECHRV